MISLQIEHWCWNEARDLTSWLTHYRAMSDDYESEMVDDGVIRWEDFRHLLDWTCDGCGLIYVLDVLVREDGTVDFT